jgi:hypothetical protein
VLVAVSPYHLTTREAPAMAALLLAERVLTMLPAPAGNGSAREAYTAGSRIPAYLAFMNTWAWTIPLWQTSLIVSELEGQSAVSDMQAVIGQVDQDERLAPLRRFMHSELYADERAYLSAVAADMLKGGPDPGINVPVAAALDRFATRHQIMVARAQPASVVQVAEARMGEGLGAVALPVLLQADADRILHAREVLADVLEPLWDAYDDLCTPGIDSPTSLEDAASAYAAAFESRRDEVTEGGADDQVRLIEGTVTLNALRMPSDVVLRSSLAAVENVSQARARLTDRDLAVPVPYDPLASQSFITLLVKPLGARQPRRR